MSTGLHKGLSTTQLTLVQIAFGTFFVKNAPMITSGLTFSTVSIILSSVKAYSMVYVKPGTDSGLASSVALGLAGVGVVLTSAGSLLLGLVTVGGVGGDQVAPGRVLPGMHVGAISLKMVVSLCEREL